jgi:hypothetical protein
MKAERSVEPANWAYCYHRASGRSSLHATVLYSGKKSGKKRNSPVLNRIIGAISRMDYFFTGIRKFLTYIDRWEFK